MTSRSNAVRLASHVLALLLACVPCTTAWAEASLTGRVLDQAGQPVVGCRVIAREADGVTFYIGTPSDDEGRYAVEVPEKALYKLIAVILQGGERIELPEAPATAVGAVPVNRDLTIEVPTPPGPRAEEQRGADRLFLAFVEDPALAHYRHYEARLDYRDFDAGDSFLVEGIVAMQFAAVPRVELGARGGYATLDISGVSDDSGVTDIDVWGKFHLWRSADTRADLTIGSIATLPTGDEASGLGQDAFQSKLFLGASYAWRSVLLVAHAGVATAENGKVFGVPLQGQVTGAAGVGLLVPFTRRASAVFEAGFEGERFEDTDSTTQLLAGVNWRLGAHGQLRVAGSVGVGDRSDLSRLLAGYAFLF